MEPEENNLLFVYGTLLMADNEFAEFLQKNASLLSVGTINGYLFDLGDYPGLVLDAASPEFVIGSVFKITNTEEVLKKLDDYEGIDQQGCEYVRALVEIETGEGLVLCWVYLYILDPENKTLIQGGDYLKYRGLR